MGRIVQLSEETINQIAAGEVVERPASVVKELVENALDAGAGRVFVTLEDGGRKLVEVLDDGAGMDAEDAVLAVRRHATSKLQQAQGLASVETLGFRGEALASIAAVSHFELLACNGEAQGGVRVRLSGGGQPDITREGFPRGCKVRVEELFFNTPARRKFLRGAQTELRRIQDHVVSLALPHWGVHFRLAHHGRMIIDWPRASSLGERVLQVFGRSMRQEFLAVSLNDGGVRAEGFVSHPTHCKASRRWQYLFINARAVRAPALQFGIELAYQNQKMVGRCPGFVLLLQLAPEEVDVNVHPAKSEVRLRNPRLVQTVLTTELGKQLLRQVRELALGPLAPAAEEDALLRDAQPQEAAGLQAQGGRPAASLQRGGREVFRVGPWEEGALQAQGSGELQFQPAAEQPGPAFGAPLAEPRLADSRQEESRQELPGAPPPASLPPLAGVIPILNGQRPPAGRALLPLSQFHNTYIIAQRGPTLVLIDQHAAHERILFEALREQLHGEGVRTQPLLFPATLDLSPQNAMLLEQHLPQFAKMGFAFEAFGPNSFLLRETPALFGPRDVQPLLLETLDELALFGKSGRVEEAQDDILALTACHSAIRAGEALHKERIQALLEQLETLDLALYCPHGRPVWVEITLHELEKRFKRIP